MKSMILITMAFGMVPIPAGSHGAHDRYAKALAAQVSEEGRVDYRSLKKDRGDLDTYVLSLGAVTKKAYETWTEKEKIAFLINAYNAFTLKAVIDHFPTKAHPAKSIRRIEGVWDELEFTLMGKRITLNGIEHGLLRARFNEPRIHMALVCAARSCPNLRSEPYEGIRLDEQLQDQTRNFLGAPSRFRIDRTKDKVHLSKIFDWFGDDFVKTYETRSDFKGHGKAERAVLNFIVQHLGEADARYLTSTDVEIEYLDYDWVLNGK